MLIGLCFLASVPLRLAAQTIVLDERDAVLWSRQHEVEGTMSGALSGVLFHNGNTHPFDAPSGDFSASVELDEGPNIIVACTDDGGVCSDTLRWELGYRIRPEIVGRAEVAGRTVTLEGDIIDNPLGALRLDWTADERNPAPVTLSGADGTDVFSLPDTAPRGEYYFDLTASESGREVARARTLVTVTADSVHAFDIDRDHAAWIDGAVLYEIAPWYFGRYWDGESLRMIADKVPEIASLGVTAIWLQPVTQSFHGGQAYDVTDYFRVWDKIGTEEDLRALIAVAHDHGLKVLLDLVVNHSSIEHPYAQDVAVFGGTSYYYRFYQRTTDFAPYSSLYTQVREGNMTFLTYFWPELVMFNYATPDLERYITEASRYWIEEFGIDGYRFDAVWGVHARDPEFTLELRRTLKRIKPEVLLLAEAKAAHSQALPADFPSVFTSFDVAYDWKDTGWCISYWAWARECLYSAYEGGARKSLFNSGEDALRAADLRSALTNGGKGYPPGARILRFLENNDVSRFRAHHSLQTTKMAAALMFSLPGLPMLYYGQESGITTQWPTFPSNRTIRSYDDEGLWEYYQYLIGIRHRYASLTGDNFEELTLSGESMAGQTFAFHRWADEEHLIGVVNMGDGPVEATLDASPAAADLGAVAEIFLTDLLSGGVIAADATSMSSVPINLQPNTAALYVVADSVLQVTVPGATLVEDPDAAPAARLQIYPNPARTSAILSFGLDRWSEVQLKIFDVLGREVVRVVQEPRAAGDHVVTVDLGSLPSGVYVCSLETDGHVVTHPLVVVR